MPSDVLALKQILPLLIPIVAIMGGLAVAIVSIALDYKKKSQWLEAHHRERLAAIERGTELPPLPAGFFGERAPADAATRQARQVRWGLVLALGGAALGVLLAQAQVDLRGGDAALCCRTGFPTVALALLGLVEVGVGQQKRLIYRVAVQLVGRGAREVLAAPRQRE